MRFADYSKQSFWALLDKTLPVIYGIGFIVMPVRVLSELEFGLLTLFQNFFYFAILVDISLVQVPMAKFIAECDESSWAVTSAALLSLTVLILCSFIGGAGAPLFAFFAKAPELRAMLWYLPLLLVALYFKNLSCQICISQHETAKLFIIDATYFLGSLALLVIWQQNGKLGDAIDVVLINIYAATVASGLGVILTYQSLRQAVQSVRREQLRRVFDLGKYALGSGFASYLYQQGDIYLVSSFYNPAQVGVYNAGKIIYRFYNILSQAAQIVLLPLASRFASANQRDELRALMEKAVSFFYLALVPVNLILLLNTDTVFSLLYGCKYTEAIGVFRWLVVGTFFMPWGAVGSNLLIGMGSTRLSFRIAWWSALANLVLDSILIPKLNILGAALANTITMGLGAVLVFSHLKRLLNFNIRSIWGRRLDAWALRVVYG